MNAPEGLLDEARRSGIERVVVGAIVRHAGRILLLRRAEDDFLGGLYELPSGRVEAGESLRDALHREVREECHLEITEVVRYVGHFDYCSSRGVLTRQFTFLVTVREPLALRLSEHSGSRWIRPDQWPDAPVSESVRMQLADVATMR